MWADTQICFTGAFGLTTNLAGGSSNSMVKAPPKSVSKPCSSEAWANVLYNLAKRFVGFALKLLGVEHRETTLTVAS